jgi:hypothetical protein
VPTRFTILGILHVIALFRDHYKDVTYNNVLLNKQLNTKLSDFRGSSLDRDVRRIGNTKVSRYAILRFQLKPRASNSKT